MHEPARELVCSGEPLGTLDPLEAESGQPYSHDINHHSHNVIPALVFYLAPSHSSLSLQSTSTRYTSLEPQLTHMSEISPEREPVPQRIAHRPAHKASAQGPKGPICAALWPNQLLLLYSLSTWIWGAPLSFFFRDPMRKGVFTPTVLMSIDVPGLLRIDFSSLPQSILSCEHRFWCLMYCAGLLWPYQFISRNPPRGSSPLMPTQRGDAGASDVKMRCHFKLWIPGHS